MQSKRSSDLILGVMVTGRMLHAVLVQQEAQGPRILRRFTRQRVTRASQSGMLTNVPELQEEAAGDNDFTIQFGDGTESGNNLFLSSEFSGVSGFMESEDELNTGVGANFVLELGDILAECKDTGYEDPIVAFCADSADVMHVELRVPESDKKSGKAKTQEENPTFRVDQSERPALIKLLGEQYQGGFESDRVGFLRMTNIESSESRYLAVFPKQRDSVIATLLAMREQQSMRLPTVRVLDAEAPLYLGLARSVLRSTASAQSDPLRTHSLVVRAGIEDTLVLFMRAGKLLHYESLRSLTAYESPETICSRVLLQQDEHGINDVQYVFLLSEEREEELIESFEMFFPDSHVSSLRYVIDELGELGLDEANTSAIVGAVAAALRLSPTGQFEGVFDEINLMPKRLIKQRFKIPITWHVPALGFLIGLTVLFFMYRYFTIEKEIDGYIQKLGTYPPEIMEADSRTLQARIDSFDAVTTSYLKALDVLDDLLLGSDKWSRTLEHVSNATSSVRSIWIDNWRPEGEQLIIMGNATSRERVVTLAERLNGDIEFLNYSEIREAEVFSFQMRIPLLIDLPEAAIYLRQQVADIENDENADPSGADTSIVVNNNRP
ncbi:MAG: hypothetical protein KTR29_11345 [Rhodothermaceae bacterium]|nr:hypothetical protein [Rhodothermaceae bacterium]